MPKYIAVAILRDDANSENVLDLILLTEAMNLKFAYRFIKQKMILKLEKYSPFIDHPSLTRCHFLDIRVSLLENDEIDMIRSDSETMHSYYEKVSTFWKIKPYTDEEIVKIYLDNRVCNGCQAVDVFTDWTGHCQDCLYFYSKN